MKINIGTNQGNIVGVEIDKQFNDITFEDIMKIAKQRFPKADHIMILGWTPHKSNSNH